MTDRREASRLEGFSDAVFGFALTLLVVSLEVPTTYGELIDAIRAFPVFAVCFVMLFQVWWRHYRFFRTYDLEDTTVVLLTGLLLFVVLFYVYPLKFMWMLVFSQFGGSRMTPATIRVDQVPTLFYIYGAGIISVFGILALLHLHAYRKRHDLALTPELTVVTRWKMVSNFGVAGVALLSIGVAMICAVWAPTLIGFAGYTYASIGIVEFCVGYYKGRELEQIALSTTNTAPV